MGGTIYSKTGVAGGTGGAGQTASVSNAVSGSAPGGTLNLQQTATGGAGGSSGIQRGVYGVTSGGAGGYGTSTLSVTDTTAAALIGSVYGYGGAGGNVDAGASGAGGAGSATVVLTGAGAVNATATGKGGGGGSLYVSADPRKGPGAVYEGNGSGGVGGKAYAAATATTTSTTANVTATATATGGAGGTHLGVSSQVITGGSPGAAIGAHASARQAAGATGGTAYAHAVETVLSDGASGLGANVIDGAGGAVFGSTAYASGYNAKAVVSQSGGAGVSGLGGATGGAGASSTLTNAVSGATDGGTLKLYQTAAGGNGGYAGGPGGTAGAGGAAGSYLTFDDTKNPVAASAVTGSSSAYGGFGGNGGSGAGTANGPPGGVGGAATATIALTGANAVAATANATGGRGGGNDAVGGAATATATARSTTTTGADVTATANATGGGGGSNTTNNSGAGGAVTGTTATATEAAKTSGVARATATAQGGSTGGAANGTGYTGGAGGAASGTTATAVGFNAVATVNQTGGSGDGGLSGAGGGAGAASMLTNAAGGYSYGGYLTLSQTAAGGSGGGANTNSASAGNGGAAGSYLTVDDTKSPVPSSALTGTVNAFGGAGGNGVASGGNGAAGTARISLTGANVVSASGTARGGAGGAGGAQGAGGAAAAQVTAITTGMAFGDTATANAGAYAGAGSHAGHGTAEAAAITSAGQMASATSNESGSAGLAAASATTSASGILTMVTAGASASGQGGLTAMAQAADNNAEAPFFPNGALPDYALAFGGNLTSFAAGSPTLAAVFGASAASVVGGGAMGENLGGGTGTYTLDSSSTWTIDPATLHGDLIAGMVTAEAANSGFTSLAFTIDVNGTAVNSETFTSLPAAEAFFTDNAVNLGALPGASSDVVSLNLAVTTTANNDFGFEYLLGTAVPCFATGTRIATGSGDVAVEDLAIGQTVLARRGGVVPVRWIGHRRVDCRRYPRPHDVWPVRVRAGAFADDRPARDLVLSPDHAVLIDGVLIPIRYLVNGATIVQERVAEVTYWHVELPRHDILLAEGLACESYLDTGNRDAFDNGGTLIRLHADFAPDRAGRQTWATHACAPLVLDGPVRAAAHERLRARAERLGHELTGDPDLRLRAQGRLLRPQQHGRCYFFALPPGARRVHLLSRSVVPGQRAAALADHRRLGVAVAQVLGDQGPLGLDDAVCLAGWHAPEDGYRWTDGDAVLNVAGVRTLAVTVRMTEQYWRKGGTVALSGVSAG